MNLLSGEIPCQYEGDLGVNISAEPPLREILYIKELCFFISFFPLEKYRVIPSKEIP